MTLTIELSPQLEAQLQEAAARRGQDPATFVTATLTDALRGNRNTATPETSSAADGTTRETVTPLSLAELEAALDELEAIGVLIPPPETTKTHWREDIYFDVKCEAFE